MKGKNLDHLLRENYFNRVIEDVERNSYEGEDRLIKYPLVCVRYLSALIAVSRFEDAERICKKCLLYLRNNRDKQRDAKHLEEIFSYLLAETYFYSEKYHKLFAILELITEPCFEKVFRRSVLTKILDDATILRGSDVNFGTSLVTNPLHHINGKHGFEFFKDPEKVLETVKANFDKPRTYNQKFAFVKMFKCDNIGIFLKNHAVCNYIIVAACTNNSDHILSMYPVQLPGDMEYFDITDMVASKHIEDDKINEAVPTLSRIDKFRQRSMKKKN